MVKRISQMPYLFTMIHAYMETVAKLVLMSHKADVYEVSMHNVERRKQTVMPANRIASATRSIPEA